MKTKAYVEFWAPGPRLRVRVLPGDGHPQVSDGYGGFETVTRPFRIGLTRWTGFNPIAVDIPILFDAFRAGDSVEDDIKRLERMAGRDTGLAREPFELRIRSPGRLVPHQDACTWVITSIDWGDAVTRTDGKRMRQAATVSVLQLVEDAREVNRSAARRRAEEKKKRHHPRKHVVKKGETLQKIARKVLGDESRWHEIRTLNHIADPRKVGKCTDKHKAGCIGSNLRIPR